jgi:hypothetical protein
VPRAPIVLALLSWPLSCCCDEPECGDDRRDPGELCFVGKRLGIDPQIATPLALRSGLFDDDDKPDVLVLGTDVSGVSGRLLQGDGEGGLGEPRTAPVTGCSAYPIAGDLDGDGRLDLVFASCTQSVLVFRSTGSADFAAPVEIPVGVVVRQAVIADVDGDGGRDLLILGLDTNGVPTLSFAQGLADGSFAPAFLTPQPVAAFPDLTPGMMVAGRLDRSGRFEVIYAEAERSGALVRTHYAGAATFAAPDVLATSLRPAGLALRDLDGDDDLDLLTGERSRGELVSFLSAGDDLEEGPRTELVGTAWQTFKLGQLDDDGAVDLAVITEDHVELFRGLGDGSFESGSELAFPSLIAELALVDLNADGRDDLVAGTFTGDDPLTIVLSGP